MAISRAASTGVRNGVMNTLGPNLSRVVRAATAAMAVIGSGTGTGEDRRSENHTESITLFREKMAEFVAYLRREIADERDPEAKLRRLVALHFTVLEQNPALAEVVQIELRQGHKFFRGASAHEVSAYFDLIGSILEEGVAAGRFHADLPVKVATKVLFGAMV